jgi:adenine-specific DNA-methyltransferase
MGLELSLPMETKAIDNKQVYYVGYNSLVACFEDYISEEVVKEIAETKPLKVVFKDTSFEKDDQRINLEETFKQISPDTIIKVI